jgi:hypothetical protein
MAAEATYLSTLGSQSSRHLAIDWTHVGLGPHMFWAVLAWSRYPFIRFASNEACETTLCPLAEIRTETERAFLALGPIAETLLPGRPPPSGPHDSRLSSLTSSPWSRVGRAISCFPCWNGQRASDASRRRTSEQSWPPVRLPRTAPAGKPLSLSLPDVPVRRLSGYALEEMA